VDKVFIPPEDSDISPEMTFLVVKRSGAAGSGEKDSYFQCHYSANKKR
jgi:hypothetical protein